MRTDNTKKYKYLGEVIKNKITLEDHITQIRGRAEAAYQTILVISEDRHFKYIKMK